jgi:hypothetical protein
MKTSIPQQYRHVFCSTLEANKIILISDVKMTDLAVNEKIYSGKNADQSLYTWLQIVACVALGGPLGAVYLMAHNFKVLGNEKRGKTFFIFGVAATIMFFASLLIIPMTILDEVRSGISPLLILPLFGFLFIRYQAKDVKNGLASGKLRGSWWKTLAISLISLSVMLVACISIDLISFIKDNKAITEYNLGVKYSLGNMKNYPLAFRHFQFAANKNFPPAQFALGRIYSHGYGVKEDSKKSLYWTLLAAKNGYAQAQLLLGLNYELGREGFPKDSGQSVKWLTLAAKQHDSRAEFLLGAAYYYGSGVEKNVSIAMYWLKQSAKGGDTNAKEMLSSIQSSPI